MKFETTENETKWYLDAITSMVKEISAAMSSRFGSHLPEVGFVPPEQQEPAPVPQPEGNVYPFPRVDCQGESVPAEFAPSRHSDPEPAAPADLNIDTLFAEALRNIPTPAKPEMPAHLAEHYKHLGTLTPEERVEAHRAFRTFLAEWLVGWEDENAPQARRVELMEDLGSGRQTRGVLILAYERLALQTLVLETLRDLNDHRADDLDAVERLTANLVQLANPCGFPELVGTMDYTKRWRRQ